MRKYLNLRANIALGLIFVFFVNFLGPLPIAQAQEIFLPPPGEMVSLSPEFNPAILKGIKIHPDNPFRFDFILDQGDLKGTVPRNSRGQSPFELKKEATKLIKYFLASLSIPEKDLWVNLSPYEKDRIIPNSFGRTEMGRDLLAEDYMLKQITASLIYPEGKVGKQFWKKVYEEAFKKYGTTNVSVNTFNKVWIVPEKAVIYENAKVGTAYVVESKLKVMLEEDYLSLEKHSLLKGTVSLKSRKQSPSVSALGSQVVREIVIPELTKEVNEDKNFFQLRQVYNSLILATWYKNKVKESLLSQVYGDKEKTVGVGYDPKKDGVESIYQRYLMAFKKGVYNYIKNTDAPNGVSMPRKYFSGGLLMRASKVMTKIGQLPDNAMSAEGNELIVSTSINDYAMNIKENVSKARGSWAKLTEDRDEAMLTSEDSENIDKGRILDAVIIGGGPAGLMMSQRLKRKGLKYITLQSGRIGGSWNSIPELLLVQLNPVDFTGMDHETAIQFGHISKDRKNALNFMRWYVDHFGFKPNIKENQVVENIYRRGGNDNIYYEIVYRRTSTAKERSVFSRNVIFATGIYSSGIGPLNVEGEGEYADRIMHMHGKEDVAKLRAFKRKVIVVVGAGLSGVLITLALRRIAKKVILVYPQPSFPWLHDAKQLMREETVHFGIELYHWRRGLQPGDAELILEEDSRVGKIMATAVELRDSRNQKVYFDYDHIIMATGYTPTLDFFKKQGIGVSGGVRLSENLQALDEDGNEISGFFVLGTKYGDRGVPIKEMNQQVQEIARQLVKDAMPSDLKVKAQDLGQEFANQVNVQEYRHSGVRSLLQAHSPAEDVSSALSKDGPKVLPFMNVMNSIPRYGTAGDSILKHTMDIMFFVQSLGDGNITAFNEGKGGWSMTEQIGQKYREAYQSLTEHDRELLNLFILLHDIGVCIQNLFHPEMGAIMAEIIMQKLGYSPEDIKFVSWLVYHHVDLGTLFTAETTPQVLQDALQELPTEMRYKAKIFLALHTIGETRVIRNGSIVGERNADFYLTIMRENALNILASDFDEYRIKMFASNDQNELIEERQVLVEKGIETIPQGDFLQFKETFRSIIQNIRYSVNFLRRLEPEALVKMLYLLSQIEKMGHNQLDYLSFTAPSQEVIGPAAKVNAVLSGYTMADLKSSSSRFKDAIRELNISWSLESRSIQCDNKDLAMRHNEGFKGGIDFTPAKMNIHVRAGSSIDGGMIMEGESSFTLILLCWQS